MNISLKKFWAHEESAHQGNSKLQHPMRSHKLLECYKLKNSRKKLFLTITTNFLLINKTNLLKAQGSKIQVYKNYTRENNHQDQEQGKRAQKSAKLDNHQ
jgi:hypothetical protein